MESRAHLAAETLIVFVPAYVPLLLANAGAIEFLRMRYSWWTSAFALGPGQSCAVMLVSVFIWAYVARIGGERLCDFGISFSARSFARGTVLLLGYFALLCGIVISICLFFSADMIQQTGARQLSTIWQLSPLVALGTFVVGPIWEECVLRAYMMTRLWQMGAGNVPPVVITVAAEISCHLNQEPETLAVSAALFAVMSVFYVRYKDTTALLVAHFLYNITIAGLEWLDATTLEMAD